MKRFDERTANSGELYDWCTKEYQSANPISKVLIYCFYKVLSEKILHPIKPNLSKILEIGSGAGESTLRIQEMVKGIQYDATEYDLRYIEAIKKRDLQINVSQENVYHINRPNSSYECLIMLEVLEHLDDVGLALAELFRVSSRYVIISVPHEPLWRLTNLLRCKYVADFGNTPGHINHFNKRKLKKCLIPHASNITFYFTFPWIILIAEK
jgi:ubiquinone/menaquinone biosynthesis C-methylase UbiE